MRNITLIICFAFSLGALCLSAYAVSSQYYADIPTTILSLVGICVTLVVAISVVDSFAVHQALEKNKEEMKVLQNKTKELGKMETKISKMRKQTNILFHHTWGLSYSEKQPYAALCEFWRALELTAKDDDIKRAKSCIENAKEVVNGIIQRREKNDDPDTDIVDKLPTVLPPNMKDSKVYIAFKYDIDELINKISKILRQ